MRLYILLLMVITMHVAAAQTPPRPLAEGPARFVDAANGLDTNAGTELAPWQTINHALTQLSPGETLYLRAGTYFENVTCAVAGEADQPITIRSYPGEDAIIDGGLPSFQQSPATSWEPVPDGAPDEYRSSQTFKNIRDVVGRFADSHIGLQTYWYIEDLRATNELWLADPDGTFNPQPVYCGPGLWYDKRSGRIHVRLAHTHIENEKVTNYRGATDPRTMPLMIAPFGGRALFIDQAMHVRFQDLTLQGGGYNTVFIQQGIDLDFDNVTIYAGSYGLRSQGTGPLRFWNSAIHGNIPPWGFRKENSLRGAGPGHATPFMVPEGETPPRNIARLNTHAVLVTEGSFEFEIFYHPYNHDWEIAYSEFSDGHDGVYLSGHNIRFHHNYVHHFQDDSVFLGAPSANYSNNVQVYQNLFQKVGMSFGGYTRGGPTGNHYIFRNICDQRAGVNWSRPSDDNPAGDVMSNLPLVIHGRLLLGMESWYFYHNLFISPNKSRRVAYGYMLNRTTPETSRWLMNNLFVYLNDFPTAGRELPDPLTSDIAMDGNLHWSPKPDAEPPAQLLPNLRTQQRGTFSDSYPHPWATHSLLADPGWQAFDVAEAAANDYRLRPESPAVDAGVPLPDSLPDVLPADDAGRPDIGPVPLGTETLPVGRFGRIDALRPPPTTNR